MRDDVILACVIVVACWIVASTFALAWLCGQVSKMRGPFVMRDDGVTDALARLEAGQVANVLADEVAARLAKRTSAAVDVGTELGHQAAAGDRIVKADLAASIGRADDEESGEPGAAADAGLRSEPKA